MNVCFETRVGAATPSALLGTAPGRPARQCLAFCAEGEELLILQVREKKGQTATGVRTTRGGVCIPLIVFALKCDRQVITSLVVDAWEAEGVDGKAGSSWLGAGLGPSLPGNITVC